MARGDLISIPCVWKLIPYRHYGIDIGDGTVVHLATVSGTPKRMLVQRVSMEAFCESKTPRNEPVQDSLSADEVVERALAAVGQEEYHLVLGNCEHFSRRCKSDRFVSHQVDRAARSLIRIGIFGLVATSTRAAGTQVLSSLASPRILASRAAAVSALVGEAARHGAYAISRSAKLEHREAERLGITAGIAAATISGISISGTFGGMAAAAVYATVDVASSAIFRRVTDRSRNQVEID